MKVYAADFETTVYDGQERTDVWAAAIAELNTDNVELFGNIYDFWQYICKQRGNCRVYFHNLKFDGAFLLNFFISKMQYAQATNGADDESLEFLPDKEMENNSFKYIISDMGQWYSITVKVRGKIIEIRDSLKLLPFTLEQIGRSFKTKHQKLSMEYTGFRYPNCLISAEEAEYIKNDVYVLKEALEMLTQDGHTKLTIGSCCLSEYKKDYARWEVDEMFPRLDEIVLPSEIYGAENADAYIRKAYRGGWCYVTRGKERRIFKNGCTADVNSLYPSMMHSDSGNIYPIGKPTFWHGDFIPPAAQQPNKYFFVRVRFRFNIRPGYLPFIQIKNTFRYQGNMSLETSDLINDEGKRSRFWTDAEGRTHDTNVTLTFTCTDWKLINEHYYVNDCEILDGCYFEAKSGIFDNYINKYKKIKQESKGAQRQLAKLYLNNLYGKLATSTNSSFKVVRVDETGILKFREIPRNNKAPVYIPCGAAITSYARNFTIRAAQANYHGVDAPGFIYADTDSIHCDLPPEQIRGIAIHDTEFCCWKIESEWDEAFFTRQKTYIEHVVKTDGEPCTPQYEIRCAGMGKRCKELFAYSLSGESPESFPGYENLTDEQKEFIQERRALTDFDIGLQIPGNLKAKQIAGGVLLEENVFEMR